MADFAEVADIHTGRRPLPAGEQADIERAIWAASQWIRDRRPGIPDGDKAAQYVVIDVVKTAVATGKHRGLSSFSRTVGGVSRAGTITGPGGALEFTAFHHQLLGLSASPIPRGRFD